MVDTPLTYEQLFDTLRREKSRDDLQKLEQDFYEKVRFFLHDKQSSIKSENSQGLGSLAVQRASIELQNARKILKELYERRERKIVTLALHRARTDGFIDTDALLQEERVFLDDLVGILMRSRDKVLAAESWTPMTVTPFAQAPSSYDQDAPVAREEPRAGRSVKVAASAPEGVEVGDGDTVSTFAEGEVMVRITKDVPKFMGKDMRMFGPFVAGEETSLPDDIAAKLFKIGRAEPTADSSTEE